jgi:hypothetical protein
LASSLILASGSHLPLVPALVVIAVVVLLKVVVGRSTGRSASGGDVVVRCGKGHIFTTRWSSLGSLTSIRLGSARFQRCPVGNHWSVVRPAKDRD